jgi:hypothetical protein
MLMFYAIIIVLFISIDKSNIRTRSLRNTHSQETQHLSWETLQGKKTQQKLPYHKLPIQCQEITQTNIESPLQKMCRSSPSLELVSRNLPLRDEQVCCVSK